MRHLLGLERLESLALPGTQVSDRGLEALCELKHLKVIDLDSGRITDEGVRQLAKWKSLEIVKAWGANITDAGVEHFTGLDQLDTVLLRSTCVTDNGLRAIARHENLRVLDLQSTRISDAGLQYLAAMTNLENLDLRGAHVTDAGIPHLAACKNLQRIGLQDTRVSEYGIERLKAALPECTIDFAPMAWVTPAPGEELNVAIPERLPAGLPTFVEEFDESVAATEGSGEIWGQTDGIRLCESSLTGAYGERKQVHHFSEGCVEVTARVPKGYGNAWFIDFANGHPEYPNETKQLFNIKILHNGAAQLIGTVFPEKPNVPFGIKFMHPAVKPRGDWNTLRFFVNGDTLEIWVNSQRVCRPVKLTAPLAPGALRIGVIYDHGRARAEFDRVAVWNNTDAE